MLQEHVFPGHCKRSKLMFSRLWSLILSFAVVSIGLRTWRCCPSALVGQPQRSFMTQRPHYLVANPLTNSLADPQIRQLRISRHASDTDDIFEQIERLEQLRKQPRKRKIQPSESLESGRNPEAVAYDLIGLVAAVPGSIVAFVAITIFLGFVRYGDVPPPQVTLSEALTKLVAIEDDYYALGPGMGLRQRVATWFRWAEVDRRVEVEAKGLPTPVQERVKKLGKDARDYIASVVEYSGYSANGIGDGGESGRLADKVAAAQARAGLPQQEEFSIKALGAGRQALSDALRIIDDAKALD